MKRNRLTAVKYLYEPGRCYVIYFSYKGHLSVRKQIARGNIIKKNLLYTYGYIRNI